MRFRRSYRMWQGPGVHSFRLVDAEGASQFVKDQFRHRKTIHCVDSSQDVLTRCASCAS